MKWQDKQGGFTLIEILLVMAISALLAVTLFSTYSSAQARSRFSDAVERTAAIIERTQSEVSASFTTSLNGNDPSTIFYGKLVEFGQQGSTSVTIKAMTVNLDSQGNIHQIHFVSPTTSTFAWGAQVNGTPTNPFIAWVRDINDGSLHMYNFSSEPVAQDPSSYTSDNQNSSTIEMISPEGLKAIVTADSSNLQVTRDYEN